MLILDRFPHLWQRDIKLKAFCAVLPAHSKIKQNWVIHSKIYQHLKDKISTQLAIVMGQENISRLKQPTTQWDSFMNK